MQEAGIPCSPGCLEHTCMICHQIQAWKKEGRDVHVLLLKLANVFGSIPHSLLWTAFDFFQAPTTMTNLNQKLLPRAAVLSHNSRVHYSMVIFWSRSNGRLHHLPPSLHYGNGTNLPSIQIGCRRRIPEVWGATTFHLCLHGRHDHPNINCRLYKATAGKASVKY